MLKWTNEPPTQEGWYFFQRIDHPIYPVRMVYCIKEYFPFVRREEMAIYHAHFTESTLGARREPGFAICDLTEKYRWAGPIPEPAEKEV